MPIRLQPVQARPQAVRAMARQGNIVAPSAPEAAVQFFRSEQERYARLAKKAGITPGVERPASRRETFDG